MLLLLLLLELQLLLLLLSELRSSHALLASVLWLSTGLLVGANGSNGRSLRLCLCLCRMGGGVQSTISNGVESRGSDRG